MIKIKKILIGSHNKGKIKELSYLLPKKIKKISPFDLKIKSPKETGKTYGANSRLKANYFSKKSKLTSISDDSGLSVDCLNRKPGIYSARFARQCGGFNNAMKKIINMVNNKNKNIKNKNRKAKFICSLSIKEYKKKLICVQGEIHGNISEKIIGKNGFGYDSIFIPKNYKITFGEMLKKKKF